MPAMLLEGPSVEYLLFLLLLVYLAPFSIAVAREHPRAHSILAINLALGWTGVGWFAALAWAWPAPIRRAWAGLTGSGPPRLVLLPTPRPAPTLSASRVGMHDLESRGAPPLLFGATALGLLLALSVEGSLPTASWWPEAQGPAATSRAQIIGLQGTDLRARPRASAPAVGRLSGGCSVRVLDHRRGWKRIWRAGSCARRAGEPNQGWIPAATAGPEASR